MNFSLFHPITSENTIESDHQTLVLVVKEQNITDGCEFLDDAIRLNDQPLMLTEENVAPGSFYGLL
jgi:hypothetical protein